MQLYPKYIKKSYISTISTIKQSSDRKAKELISYIKKILASPSFFNIINTQEEQIKTTVLDHFTPTQWL
jgi:hypothetical protein